MPPSGDGGIIFGRMLRFGQAGIAAGLAVLEPHWHSAFRMQGYLRVQLGDMVVRNAEAEALSHCRGNQDTLCKSKAFADALARPCAKGNVCKTVTTRF